jgi:hypothetical protein
VRSNLFEDYKIVAEVVSATFSIPDPLHIFEEDLLATIIELGGAAVSVTCYPLGHLQSAVIF